MAVQLETKDIYSTTQILSTFGIDDDVIHAFKAQGYAIAITPTSLKIVQKNSGGATPVASVPVKAGAALFAMKGSLAASSLQSVGHKIMGVIEPLIGSVNKKSSTMDAIEATVEESGPTKKYAEDEMSTPEPVVAAKTSGKVVLLSKATKLYQKVKGTTEGSRYIVIAVSDELKIAARYNGSTLSIRVEGEVAKHEKRITEAGFDKHKDNYASIHLKTDNQVLARRAASSVLGGLDIQFKTPWPDFKKMSEGIG